MATVTCKAESDEVEMVLRMISLKFDLLEMRQGGVTMGGIRRSLESGKISLST